ncbi:hypothetical protein AKJ09_03531 [Labilithrix luteola]|uniref:Uncharacterized protein n=1 Tax=Labilithrix luteola TaxID=1391654 RepID=A0A0K1PTM2_9BACT|nr:hypothetical protein AKJ09_03531 [Labilithrix luteola]
MGSMTVQVSAFRLMRLEKERALAELAALRAQLGERRS